MKNVSRLVLFSLIYFWVMFGQIAIADQYHYNNILIGDRAIGLGGAYTAISDDASGVYYNPAGLAFALSNDVSGSANALYSRKTTYKKTISNDDFVEESGGSVPSFFGGLQKLDHISKGLVFAFGMYTTDSELKDQDDLIENVALGSPGPCYRTNADGSRYLDANGNEIDPSDPDLASKVQKGADRPQITLDRFHRTVNIRGSTFYGGAALGYRISPDISIGFGMNYVTIDELVQEYQDTRESFGKCSPDGSYQDVIKTQGQNVRQRLVAYGVQPVFGIQAALLDRFSFGLSLKTGMFVSQSFEKGVELRRVDMDKADQTSIDTSASGATIATVAPLVQQVAGPTKSEEPLGSTMPLEMRLGVAYFASTRLLLAYDLTYYGETKASETDSIAGLYDRSSIMNHALGMEYYLIPAIPLRLGLFTNNDARPEVEKSKTNQPDHIDFLGVSMFAAWVQPNSQIGAGVILQNGTGQAQKIANSPVIQDVEATSFTFAFSATHSF